MAALSGLPRRLVEQNIISPQQAQEIFAKAKEDKTHFVGAAVSMGKVKPRVLALMASEEFGIPFLDLTAFEIELMPQDIINKELIEKHRVLPLFKRGNRLYVAQSDPSAITAIDEIKFTTGMSVEPILVEEDRLSAAVERFMSANDDAFADLDEELDDRSEEHTSELQSRPHLVCRLLLEKK